MSTKTSMTYQDYAAMPQDGLRHEIVDGEHFVSPAPSLYHQHVSRHLQLQLMLQYELKGHGWVFNAPVDVQLSPHDIVQPDLVIVSAARKSILTPAKVKGIPDLIVEILSPSTSKNDNQIKRELYEKFSVPEYWIVDPDDQSILQLVLKDSRYSQLTCQAQVTMCKEPCICVELRSIW
ncbi:MAG: Uma2 family endonuclease [Pirellula sp.]